MFASRFVKRLASTTSASSVSSQQALYLQKAKDALNRATVAAEPLVYYGRVGYEFVRQVAVGQSLLNPGSFATAQAGISNFFLAFQTGAWKRVTLGQVGELAGKGIQIAGFFLAGEMIGRGSVIGYQIKDESGGHAHH